MLMLTSLGVPKQRGPGPGRARSSHGPEAADARDHGEELEGSGFKAFIGAYEGIGV